MRILFLVPYPTKGASNMVGVEQFIPYLESRGVKCKVRPFLNSSFFDILYSPHRYIEKVFWFIVATLNRIVDLIRAFGYDIIFIHRETYPFGGPLFESILHKIKKILVFDFDDAIFLPNTSEHNIYIERFKKPDKTSQIIKMSSYVIAGNEYLLRYALRFNKNSVIIPSSVDTEIYRPVHKADAGKEEVVIGWIGSDTTKRFLYSLEDVFSRLSGQYENIVFKIVGASFYSSKITKLINKNWRLEDEIRDLQSFDIGVMPMPDDEWTRGKCGFKTILYMACGIPVVVSPIGVNVDIVEDGINGFLAEGPKDWFDKLSKLIEDGKLRERMGKNGREKVVSKYSSNLTAPLFYKALKTAFEKSLGGVPSA